MTNMNPETGIRYGIVAANSLHGDVICELQANGKDLHWEEFAEDVKRGLQGEVDYGDHDDDPDFDFDEELDSRMENAADHFYDDEPVHEFDYQGVQGRTTWLGGALLVWVFESKWTTNARLCSPCVPNCCDLDSPDPDGYEGYDVNPEWRTE